MCDTMKTEYNARLKALVLKHDDESAKEVTTVSQQRKHSYHYIIASLVKGLQNTIFTHLRFKLLRNRITTREGVLQYVAITSNYKTFKKYLVFRNRLII